MEQPAAARPNSPSKRYMSAHELEGDGVVLALYSYLLKAQKRRGSSSADDSPRRDDFSTMPIPDTVVYDRNFPHGWFRYVWRDEELVRLPGAVLDAQSIFEGFGKASSHASGICAQFVCDTDPQGGGGLQVHFLDRSQLEDFVHNRRAWSSFVKHGLLQRFVPPRAGHNDMLEVVWSPKSSIVRRAMNTTKLASRQAADVRLRAATFDGPPHLSVVTDVNRVLEQRLKRHVASLTSRLLSHEHKVVSRLVLHCKQDADGDMWLLYATSLRIDNDAHTPSVPRPRLPLDLVQPVNFTPDVRRQRGIDSAALEDACNLSVAPMQNLSDDGRMPESIITYREPSPRPLRARNADAVQRDPTPLTVAVRKRAPRAEPAAAAPSNTAQRLLRLVDDAMYEMQCDRTTPASVLIARAANSKAAPCVTVPTEVVDAVGVDVVQALLEDAMGLELASSSSDCGDLRYTDGAMTRVRELCASRVGSGTAARLEQVNAVDRALRALPPLGTTRQRCLHILGLE